MFYTKRAVTIQLIGLLKRGICCLPGNMPTPATSIRWGSRKRLNDCLQYEFFFWSYPHWLNNSWISICLRKLPKYILHSGPCPWPLGSHKKDSKLTLVLGSVLLADDDDVSDGRRRLERQDDGLQRLLAGLKVNQELVLRPLLPRLPRLHVLDYGPRVL